MPFLLISTQANAWSVVCLENTTLNSYHYDVVTYTSVTGAEAANYGYIYTDSTLYWGTPQQSRYYEPTHGDYLPNHTSSNTYSVWFGVEFDWYWIYASRWHGRGVLTNYAGSVLWPSLLECDPDAYWG